MEVTLPYIRRETAILSGWYMNTTEKKVGSVETLEHNFKKMISGKDDPYESLVYLLENIFEYRLYYS